MEAGGASVHAPPPLAVAWSHAPPVNSEKRGSADLPLLFFLLPAVTSTATCKTAMSNTAHNKHTNQVQSFFRSIPLGFLFFFKRGGWTAHSGGCCWAVFGSDLTGDPRRWPSVEREEELLSKRRKRKRELAADGRLGCADEAVMEAARKTWAVGCSP